MRGFIIISLLLYWHFYLSFKLIINYISSINYYYDFIRFISSKNSIQEWIKITQLRVNNIEESSTRKDKIDSLQVSLYWSDFKIFKKENLS